MVCSVTKQAQCGTKTPTGVDFPSKKKKKKGSRLGAFFPIFHLQLRNLYRFFGDNTILLVKKKKKKIVIITFWFHVFLNLISCVFRYTSETFVRMTLSRDHLLEVFGAVRCQCLRMLPVALLWPHSLLSHHEIR